MIEKQLSQNDISLENYQKALKNLEAIKKKLIQYRQQNGKRLDNKE